jgi:hypothetical protein
MRGHLLSDLQPSAIFEISRDACGAKGVAPNLGLDSGRERSPPNHPPHIGLEKGIAGQLSRAAAGGAEDRPFAVLGDASGGDVLLKVEEKTRNGFYCTLRTARRPGRRPAPAGQFGDEDYVNLEACAKAKTFLRWRAPALPLRRVQSRRRRLCSRPSWGRLRIRTIEYGYGQ